MNNIATVKADELVDFFAGKELLPDNINIVDVWKEYEATDPGAICGAVKKLEDAFDALMINKSNLALAKNHGVLNRLPDYGTILDIGAGYNCLYQVMSHNYHCDYIPCDIIKRTPFTTIIPGDGTLPFDNESFNAVVCCNVFQHIHFNTYSKYLSEIARVLKVNGEAFVTVPIKPFDDRVSYAVTGKYKVPIMHFDAYAEEMLKNNLSITSFTKCNMYGIWLRKNESNGER